MPPEGPRVDHEPGEGWEEKFRGFRDFLDDTFIEHTSCVIPSPVGQRLELGFTDAEGIEGYIYLNRTNPDNSQYQNGGTPLDDMQGGHYRFRGLIRLDYGTDLWAWAVGYEAGTGRPILIPGEIEGVDEDGTFDFEPEEDGENDNEELVDMLWDAIWESHPVSAP